LSFPIISPAQRRTNKDRNPVLWTNKQRQIIISYYAKNVTGVHHL
jgi:hypothetical protein